MMEKDYKKALAVLRKKIYFLIKYILTFSMSSTRSSLGAPGPRGAKGFQGSQGAQGDIGAQGYQGETGPQGAIVEVLNDLADVVITNPQDGQTLIYATGIGFINGQLLHTSIDFSTVGEYLGSTAANEALGPNQLYLLTGDDCLRVTGVTGP